MGPRGKCINLNDKSNNSSRTTEKRQGLRSMCLAGAGVSRLCSVLPPERLLSSSVCKRHSSSTGSCFSVNAFLLFCSLPQSPQVCPFPEKSSGQTRCCNMNIMSQEFRDKPTQVSVWARRVRAENGGHSMCSIQNFPSIAACSLGTLGK